MALGAALRWPPYWRAIDQAGNTQPAPNEASIANKKTYWESNGQITRYIRIA